MDETYIGGKEKNKHFAKKRRAGRGAVGKEAVIGIRDRATKRVVAQHVTAADATTAFKLFTDQSGWGAEVYTDESRIYDEFSNHSTVNHSRGQYVKDEEIHTNGMESFWALVKRVMGVYHWWSPKHLQAFVTRVLRIATTPATRAR